MDKWYVWFGIGFVGMAAFFWWLVQAMDLLLK